LTQELKDKIKRLQKDVVQKEAKQKRVQFLKFDLVALDEFVKCDIDAMKANFEVALSYSIIFCREY